MPYRQAPTFTQQQLDELRRIHTPPAVLKGCRRGRWTTSDTMTVRRLRDRGLTIRDISLVLLCSTSSVQRALEKKMETE